MNKTPVEIEQDFEDLRVKICSQVEMAASLGYDDVTLPISEVRQLLHVLTLQPFKVKTMEQSMAELSLRRLKATCQSAQ